MNIEKISTFRFMPYSKKLLFCIFLFAEFILSCASSKKTVDCPANYLKGVGIGAGEQEALAQARVDISSQIRLSMSAANEYSKKQFISENKEVLNAKFNSQVKETTELMNAQDAKLQAIQKSENSVFAVACMSREDAAKPYLNQLPQINDSLNFAVQTVLAQPHPLIKRQAAKAAENLKIRQIMAVQVLQGLGYNIEIPKNESYEKMLKDYGEFSSNFKLIWEGSGGQISQILLSKISSRYKIETGSCVIGLKLVAISEEISCENSQYGPRCAYLPVLEGRSCGNELYFTLRSPMVYGTGLNSEAEAMRKLLATVPGASFWSKWFEELDNFLY